MYGDELYKQREELERLWSLLAYKPNDGKLTKAKARIKQWLEKTNLQLRQLEDDMEKMAEEHYSMKLTEFGGMKN